MFAKIRALPSAVWLLGLVSLVNDSASELVYPLVPLYLASVLMAGPRTLGLIEGVAEAVGSLFKLFAGVIADRQRSAKPWVVAGYSLAALGRPLIACATSWYWVGCLRFADRLSKGLRSSPRDALLARAAPADQRGLAFSLHRSLDNAGAVIGPLAAAGLLWWGVPLKHVFLWTIIPGVLLVLLTLRIREPETPLPASGKPAFSWRMANLPPVFKRYLLVLALFTLGNSSNMFLLLRAKSLGVADYQTPLLWGLVSLVAMLFATPLSALSDKLGRIQLITGGWLVYGVFYFLLGQSGIDDFWIWPLFASYGLFMAATEVAEKALVADLAPKEQLGTAYGWFNLVSGLMLLPASVAFGALWDAFSPQVAFGFSAACAMLAMVLLHLWVKPQKNQGSSE